MAHDTENEYATLQAELKALPAAIADARARLVATSSEHHDEAAAYVADLENRAANIERRMAAIRADLAKARWQEAEADVRKIDPLFSEAVEAERLANATAAQLQAQLDREIAHAAEALREAQTRAQLANEQRGRIERQRNQLLAIVTERRAAFRQAAGLTGEAK